MVRDRWRKRAWINAGIDPDAAKALLTGHSGSCDCCGKNIRGAERIDHDHETGLLRGVLCAPCNMGIGSLQDSVEGVQKALNYLRRAYKK